MNMIVPAAISATPNGTTRPQVRIVIVGHVDHGKSTLVGRLLHETGSLPEGKLEMLKAVSARRGMPFEWSFLLDALQTERDQGITIDTTQIRFRTGSRDVVLIDAPGHAEFLRNMITGASQADGAVLIIDALEGVRDQTRRHGYLLHLLGVKQVAVVVNKMDRVDFSAARFNEISDEISAHLTGLGVTPAAVIPISARDGDGVAARTPRIGWYSGPTVVEALDALEPARPLEQLALRLPVQAIYKFDDRRIVAGRIESGSLAAGDEIVIMPAGKIAKIRTVESWPVTPVTGQQTAGRSVGITLDRELFIERGDVIAHVGTSPRDTRRLRARIFWLHDKPLTTGASILVRLGTRGSPRHRGRDREGGRSRRTVERRDQGDRAQPCRRDRHFAGPAAGGRCLHRQSAHRAAGDRGQRPHRRRRTGAVGRCRTARHSRRYRAGGIGAAPRRALGALSPQRRGGLADGPAGLRQIDAGARAGTPAVRQWRLAGPARRRHAARRPQQRSRLLRARPQPKTSAGWPKSRPIWRATAISPSSPRSRPRAKTAPRRAASPTPRSARSMSRRQPRCARAAIPRAITPRRARAPCTPSPASATITSRRPPCELTIDTSTRSVAEATDEIERMLARIGILFDELGRSRRQYLERFPAGLADRSHRLRIHRACERPSQGPGFGAKRALNAALAALFAVCPENSV